MKYQLIFAENAIKAAWLANTGNGTVTSNIEESRKLADEAITWLEDYKAWLDNNDKANAEKLDKYTMPLRP